MDDEGDELTRLVAALEGSTGAPLPRAPTAEERAVLVRAWTESRDPVAMLRLLAHLHPGRHEAGVSALAECLARCAPPWSQLHETARLLARDLGREGELSGVDRYRFGHLARRVGQELAAVKRGPDVGASYDVSAPLLSARYATAVREWLSNPHLLP